MQLILMHPSFMIFLLYLGLSLIFAATASTWVIAWLALEVNMMAFLPLILKAKSKYQSESALKYFMTQTFASLLLLAAVLMAPQTGASYSVVVFSLLLKAGAAPAHQWMPSMITGLSWENTFILLTLQKIPPFILLACLFKEKPEMIYLFALASAALGALGGLSQPSAQKILVFSSIAHIAWMAAALSSQTTLWLGYFSIYTILSLTIIFYLNNMDAYKLNQLSNHNNNKVKMMAAMSFLALAGLPPFIGFSAKLMIMQTLLLSSHMSLVVMLLSSTLISLFFYMRMTLSFIMTSSLCSKDKSTLSVFTMALSTTGLIAPVYLILYKL